MMVCLICKVDVLIMLLVNYDTCIGEQYLTGVSLDIFIKVIEWLFCNQNLVHIIDSERYIVLR